MRRVRDGQIGPVPGGAVRRALLGSRARASLVLVCAIIGCQDMMRPALIPQKFVGQASVFSSESVEEPPPVVVDDARLDQARSQVLNFIHRLDTTQESGDALEPEASSHSGGPPAMEPVSDAGVSPRPVPPARVDTGDEQRGEPPAEARTAQSPDSNGPPPRDSDPWGSDAPATEEASRRVRVVNVSIRQPIVVSTSDEPLETRPTEVANRPLSSADPEGVEAGVTAGVDGLIAELEARVARAPNDMDAQWRLVMLRMATGDAASAETPPTGMMEDSAELLSGFAQMMAATRRALEDPVSGVDEALVAMNALRDGLRDRAALVIPTVALCSRVQAWGLYDVLPERSFHSYARNQAIVYIELKNFTSELTDDGRFLTRLSERLEVLTPDGKVVWEHEESSVEDFSLQRREDFFVAQRVALPTAMRTGDYVLKVTVSDLLADKWTQALHPFRVGSQDTPLP